MTRLNTRRTDEFYYDDSLPPDNENAWEPVWEYRLEDQDPVEEAIDNTLNDDGHLYNERTAPSLIDGFLRFFG